MSRLDLTDRQLLRLRICDLPVLREGIERTPLHTYVRGLHRELEGAGLRHFRPKVYLGDEWFSPSGVPKIAVPFYLVHPRLKALELRMMESVEGGSPAWLRKLLRHEAGHCFDHAYELSGSRAWRQIFGKPPRHYKPEVYLPDPTSRDFVRHLDGFYAQAHPDEDFAETFAVCITPGFDWERRYKGWTGALRKCEYIADAMHTFGRRLPRIEDGPETFAAARMRTTLGRYYAKRRAQIGAHEAATRRMARIAGLPRAPHLG